MRRQFDDRREVFNNRTRVYNGQAIRWYRMSDTVRHWTSKSFMSKSHYLHYKSLHSLPKFASKTQRIQVGNGQYGSILFIFQIIIDIHGHRFEIYILVSEIHENVNIVLGIKNVFKLEDVINT